MPSLSDDNKPAKRRRLDNPVLNEDLASLDVSDDDDGDGNMSDEPGNAVYDESLEPFPTCPAFDPKIKDLKSRVELWVKNIESELGAHVSVNEDLQIMRSNCDGIMESKTKPKRVALLGGTAAGKTATLNSLVDQPGVARELSGGDACTNVPMIFEHKLTGQTRSFAGKVSYMSAKKCHQFLKEQLENYIRFKFNFDEDWTKIEKEQYEQAANTAELTFRTLFCDKLGFGSEDVTQQTLARIYAERKSRELLAQMTTWYQQRLSGKSKEDDTSYTFSEGDTAAELRSILDPLITSNHACEVPSLWPLVKEVQVGIPASRVLQHLIIHDLPALPTQTRSESTPRMTTFASARPCDSTVNDYARRFPDTFALIVTKIDEWVSPALAKDMEVYQRQSIGNYHDCQASVDEHVEVLNRIRRKLNRKGLTGAEKNTLRERGEFLQTRIEELETRMFELVVAARNAHITTRLKKEKARYLVERKEIPVFCISNHSYAVHKGCAKQDRPILDIESTGIPALRAYALRLAAPAVWDDHVEILVYRIKVLFNGVYGWAHNKPEPRNKALPEMIKTAESTWDAISDASVDRCNGRFSREVVAKLCTKRSSSLDAAISYLRNISKEWSPNTFLAFYRREGSYHTRAVGAQSWNASFLQWQNYHVFEPAWDAWSNPEDSFDDGVEKLIRVLEDIPDQLAEMPELIPALPVAAFRNILKGQIALIRAEASRIANEYQEKHRNIKLDALLDQHTGHFTQTMRPCYLEGKDDKGKGVCARLQKIVETHLLHLDPFGKATDKFEEAFQTAVSDQAHGLGVEIKGILATLDQHYERILRRDSESWREQMARYSVRRVLDEVMPDINCIEPELAAIEKKYTDALVPK